MPMSETQQRRALDGLRTLDAQAISAVFDQYFPEIHRYVYYRTGDLATAEDLASDVFVRLLEAVKRKRGPETNLKGWLLATASHVVVDHLRRRYRRPVEAISEAFVDHNPGPALLFDQREDDAFPSGAVSFRSASVRSTLTRFGCSCSAVFSCGGMDQRTTRTHSFSSSTLW